MIGWREKRDGVIAPDERLPWPGTIAMGVQHVLAMFGATVVVPLIMGFDTNLALLFSGVGTLIFFVLVKGRVPSYLGSSFAFIGPVSAVIGSPAAGSLNAGDIPKALGGILAAGLLYALIGLAVHFGGSSWIDALMPPLVTGAVVIVIGLNLAPAARGLVKDSPFLALITLLSILAIGLLSGGMLARLPILLGTAVGYLAALVFGGTSAGSQTYGFIQIQGVDLGRVAEAAWFGLPSFVTPSFDVRAISLIAPAAIVLVAENTGHVKAVEVMANRRLMPYLGRAFIGDGAATMVAALGGGTGVTTYAENIGVMAITRVYSTLLFVIAALLAILLGFSPKFGALVGSIPTGVLGGVGTVLFGLIAVTGARIWVTNQVDFSRGVNLFVAAVVLIVGAADYTLRLGDFELGGIGLGTFGAIILYQLFKRVPGGAEAEAPAEVVRNQQSPVAELSAVPRRGSAGSGRSGRSARRGRRR
jgi:putative pyrimidine permease RutG